MSNEFETVAWLKTEGYSKQVPVNVIYELDGYKPIGVWIEDEHGNDVTGQIEPDEYAILCDKATRHAVEMYTDAADMLDMERWIT